MTPLERLGNILDMLRLRSAVRVLRAEAYDKLETARKVGDPNKIAHAQIEAHDADALYDEIMESTAWWGHPDG